jgi:hypothetical protein
MLAVLGCAKMFWVFFEWMGFRTGGVLRAYKTPLDWFFWRYRDAEC